MDEDTLRIGTAGWSYPSGAGTWNGIFYPAVRKSTRVEGRLRKFDELAYYAEHFDTVEVNSSFYHPPTPQTTQKWVERTPSGFEFSMKLFQKFTHPAMFEQRKGAREAATAADVDQFRAALDPLRTHGRLGALLAQFPPSFKAEEASVDYLQWLLRAFAEYRVAVELRHRSWSDAIASTLTLLNEHQAAWVQIDEPKFRFSIAQNYLPNITGFYYLRLHGRNATQWWTHEHAEDRYNYLYSDRELDPFVDIAGAVKSLVKKMYLYTNNHFSGKAVANAIMLKQRLGQPITGDYPEDFGEHYPGVRDIIRIHRPESETGIKTDTKADAEVPVPARTLF